MVVVYSQPIPQGFPDALQFWLLCAQRKNQVEPGLRTRGGECRRDPRTRERAERLSTGASLAERPEAGN